VRPYQLDILDVREGIAASQAPIGVRARDPAWRPSRRLRIPCSSSLLGGLPLVRWRVLATHSLLPHPLSLQPRRGRLCSCPTA
jgi:hypothetical protein